TFAMYYTQPRGPNPLEVHWVERAIHISALALERALAEKKAGLHWLVHDLISDVLFYMVVEPDGRYRFLSVNPAFCRATGLREHEVVGHDLREILPAETADRTLAHFDRAANERRVEVWYDVTRFPAGVKHGRLMLTPVLDAEGRCTHLLGTVHDVTELRS